MFDSPVRTHKLVKSKKDGELSHTHARWRGEGRAGRAAPGLWNRVVVRVVVRDFQ